MKRSPVITPYSGVKEIGRNTQGLMHFFPCTETSGTSITDVAGGCVRDLAGSGFNLSFDPILRTVQTDMVIGSLPVPLLSGSFKLCDITKHHLSWIGLGQ